MIARAARDLAKGLDKELGNKLGKSMQNAAKSGEADAGRAGTALGRAFTDNALKHVNSALANLPEGDKILKGLRSELDAISKIDISKNFNEKDFIARIERAQQALKRAQLDATGVNAVSRYTNAGNAAAELGAVREIVEAARRRGFAAGDAFENAYQARLKSMRSATPDLKTRADSSPDERAANAIRQRIEDAGRLKVGDVVSRDNNPLNLKVGVKISREDLAREMATIEGLLDNFVESFQDSDLVFSFDKARQQAGAFVEDVKTQQQKAAEAEANAYLKVWDDAHAEQRRRDAKFRQDLARDHEAAEAEEHKRQKRALAELADAYDEAIKEQYKRDLRVRQDFDKIHDAAIAEDYKRQRMLQDAFLRDYDSAIAESYKRRKRADEDYARDHLIALREEAQREADMLRGGIAGRSQERTRNALGALPAIPLRLQTNDADRAIADIRSKIKGLGDFKVGIDIDTKSYADKVEREFNRLKALVRDKSVQFEIRTDAAKAASELGLVLAEIGRIDGRKAEVKVDTDRTNAGFREMLSGLTLNLGRLGTLIAVGASLGTAIVPAAAAAASAIGAIGTAGLAASVGLGVMFLGFSGIGEAVKLMGKASEAQAKSNVSLARTGNAVAGASDQIKSAEMALANTRRDNKIGAIKAQRAITDAIEDQRDAVRAAGRDMKDAIEQVGDAQRNLTEAETDATRVREGLNRAYEEAQRAIDDLNSSVRGNALDQRQATLDIAKAKEALDKVLSNPRAEAADREQARINYEERLLQMDDLQRKGTEMSAEQEKRQAAGLKGSEEVKRAEEDIADAAERVADAQRSVGRAQEDLAQTRIDSQKRIVDAQQKVADAQEAAAEQQRDAATSQFSATQSLAAAQRGLANAYNQSSLAGGAALENLNTKLAKMTPAGRAFAEYIFGLKDAFRDLKAAADPMLVGVQKALTGLIGKSSDEARTKLQPLIGFVRGVASALGDGFVRFAETLKGPTFTKFFNYIGATAVPTLERMGIAFENILVGLVNLFLGFTPLSTGVENGFVGMTESFRKWSESLETNVGFQKFMDYLKKSGPQVATFLGAFVKTLAKLVVAAAPIGTFVIDAFTKLFEWINKIPSKTLTALVGGISAAALAISVFAGATATLLLGKAGLIAGAIAALVVAFSTLVGSSDTLRGALGAAWDAVSTGAGAAFGFIKTAIQQAWTAVQPTLVRLGEMVIWLWKNAWVPAAQGIWVVIKQLYETLKPVFDLIGGLIKPLATIIWWLLKYVIIPVVAGIVYAFVKVLGPVFQFLWKYIFQPILKSLGVAFQIAAAIIKVVIGIIMVGLKALGQNFKTLYYGVIKPVWDMLLKNVFRPMGEWISKHIKPAWDKALGALGGAWEKFKRVITVPIKFIVETLLNNGILKGYNWLADKFNIEPKNVKIPPPSGGWYAAGGAVRGPGSGTSDSIRARLSNGEHVLTAKEVRAAGGHAAIYALRQAILGGGAPRQTGGGETRFADGGAVGGFGDWLTGIGSAAKKKAAAVYEKSKDVFAGISGFMMNPAGSLKAVYDSVLKQVPQQGSELVQRLLKIPGKVLGGLVDKVKGYVGLGGGGGGEYSAAGAAAGAAQFGNWPRSASAQRGDSGVWRGVVQVIKQSGINQGSFGNSYRPGDPRWHGSGRAVDWMGYNMDALASYLAARKPLELIHRTNTRDYAYTRGQNRGSFNNSLMQAHRNHIHIAYDKGGLLPDTRQMPGGTMQVFHGKRTPDKVLTDTQWTSMATLANKARQSVGGGDTLNFDFKDSTLDESRLLAIQSRRDALNRVNRRNY
jgi:hypothetical protein